jgi:hypothetical protein
MRRYLAIALAAWSLSGVGLAVAQGERPSPAVVPVEKLPRHVEAAPGKLTLFADFANKGGKGVPFYVVNRTAKAAELITYQGRPFLAAEYEAEPGKWKVAKAVDYPLCGNDLVTLKLPRDAFFMAHVPVAVSGFKARLRFRFDGEAAPVSNSGECLVSHDDLGYLLVSKAEDFGLLSKVATGEFIPPTETADLRPLAIRRLMEFEWAKAEPVLKRVAGGPDKRYAKVARDVLDFVAASEKKK